MSDTKHKQSEENLSYEESARISSNQIHAVIGAYMKNIRAQIGIGTKVQNDSKILERRVLKYNVEDIIYDRIAREKRKLKKS